MIVIYFYVILKINIIEKKSIFIIQKLIYYLQKIKENQSINENDYMVRAFNI